MTAEALVLVARSPTDLSRRVMVAVLFSQCAPFLVRPLLKGPMPVPVWSAPIDRSCLLVLHNGHRIPEGWDRVRRVVAEHPLTGPAVEPLSLIETEILRSFDPGVGGVLRIVERLVHLGAVEAHVRTGIGSWKVWIPEPSEAELAG